MRSLAALSGCANMLVLLALGVASWTGTASAKNAACDRVTGTRVDVTAFGAVGNGRQDSTDAIQESVNCLLEKGSATEPNRGGVLYFPAGRYRVARLVSFSLDGNPITVRGILIEGDGARSTALLSANGEGIFRIRLRDRRSMVEIRDLGFVAARANAGTAIEITQPPGGNRHHRSLLMADVDISSADTPGNYFNFGLYSRGLWRPLLRNVVMTGPYGPKAKPNWYKTKACFYLEDAYSPTVKDTRCWSAEKGLAVVSDASPGPEDLLVTDSKFVAVKVGIEVRGVAREPGGVITRSHINANEIGIAIKGRKLFTIAMNLMYNSYPQSTAYRDIEIQNSERILIKDNIFHYHDDYRNRRTLINLRNPANDIFITGNMFNSPEPAVMIDGGVARVHIANNFVTFRPLPEGYREVIRR